MMYLKSVLAGIAGSIVAFLLLIFAVIILGITKVIGAGTPSGGIIAFIPLGTILLGFVAGFLAMFSKLRRRAATSD